MSAPQSMGLDCLHVKSWGGSPAWTNWVASMSICTNIKMKSSLITYPTLQCSNLSFLQGPPSFPRSLVSRIRAFLVSCDFPDLVANSFFVSHILLTTSFEPSPPPLELKTCQEDGANRSGWREGSLQRVWHNWFCIHWRLLALFSSSPSPFTAFGVN